MKLRRGITLIDMLLAIALLGVFMLLAFRLVRASVHTTEQTLRADDNAARFDRAIGTLRADVADSASIEMPQPALLRIHGPDSQTIEWRSDRHSLSRSTPSENRTWDVGQPVNLKMDGAVVLVSASASDQIAMASVHSGGPR